MPLQLDGVAWMRRGMRAQHRGLVFALVFACVAAGYGMWTMGWLDRDIDTIGDDVASGLRKYLGISDTPPPLPPPPARNFREGTQRSVENREAFDATAEPISNEDAWTLSHQSRGAVYGQVSVIDADTLEMHGRRIRLWGIDAPESNQICLKGGTTQWRCGQMAALALDNHIGGRPVACYDRGEDVYGRMLGQCFIGRQDINSWLVYNGHAFAYRQYTREYTSMESRAKNRRVGVWQDPDPIRPWVYRRDRGMIQ